MAKESRGNQVGGIAFVGCILVGIALGILYSQAAVGTLLGVGIGFIVMAILKATLGGR